MPHLEGPRGRELFADAAALSISPRFKDRRRRQDPRSLQTGRAPKAPGPTYRVYRAGSPAGVPMPCRKEDCQYEGVYDSAVNGIAIGKLRLFLVLRRGVVRPPR